MAKAETAQMSPVVRTSAGLRDTLFDEMDAIRTGTGNPTRANAVARLVSGVVDIVNMEMEVEKFIGTTARRVEASQPDGFPRPLALGL